MYRTTADHPTTTPSLFALLAVALGGLGALAMSASAHASAQPVAVLVPCAWKTSDIIDERIEVSAQQSLMRGMSKGGAKAKTASAIIGAIKSGELAGVYLPSRKAVSDRGKLLSPPKGYWQLVPPWQPSTCLTEPANLAPMILYREGLTEPQIDAAIASAWAQCGKPTPAACGYNVDVTKPECMTNLDCIVENLGSVCIEHECETKTVPNGTKPAQETTPKPPQPKACYWDLECGPSELCIGSSEHESGWIAGVCKNTRVAKACYAKVSKAHKAEVLQCGVAQTPKVAKCVAKANSPASLALCIGARAFATDSCVDKANKNQKAGWQACEQAKSRSSKGRGR